jgi:hypothetical protein
MTVSPVQSFRTHLTDGMTVTSLSASLLQKITASTDHLCRIALKQIHSKRNHIKMLEKIIDKQVHFVELTLVAAVVVVVVVVHLIKCNS